MVLRMDIIVAMTKASMMPPATGRSLAMMPAETCVAWKPLMATTALGSIRIHLDRHAPISLENDARDGFRWDKTKRWDKSRPAQTILIEGSLVRRNKCVAS